MSNQHLATPPSAPANLTGREKAAVLVRLLLDEGAVPSLVDLPEAQQAEIAVQIARLAHVDQPTVFAVVQEFLSAVDRVGLSFPDGLDDALNLLGDAISQDAASTIKGTSPSAYQADPWDQIEEASPERLLPILENESREIAAIVLSKLSVPKAAELLGRIPGETARELTLGLSLIGDVSQDFLFQLGTTIAETFEDGPDVATGEPPTTRMGNILNASRSATRDMILEGLDSSDPDLAREVRDTIFTFADIPEKLKPQDIAKVQSEVAREDLLVIISGAQGDDAAAIDFYLSNISQRLAENLREEASELDAATEEETETAMLKVVNGIRALESSGSIKFIAPEA